MEERKIGRKLVVIGGSAGSLDMLLDIIPRIDPAIDYPIVLVVHRRVSNDDVLADLLGTKTTMPVKEAEEKELLRAGHIYIAPGNYHLLFEHNHSVSLDDSERINYSRPSIDVSFQSAADIYGPGLTCILLSGANADGVEGCRYAQGKGAFTIAQCPGTAGVAYMPQQAIDNKVVNEVMGASSMVGYLNSRSAKQ